MLLKLNDLKNLETVLNSNKRNKYKIIDYIYYDFIDMKYDEMLYNWNLNDILNNSSMRNYNIDNFYNTYFDIDLYDPSTGYINDDFINDIIDFIHDIGVYELPDYIYDFMEYQTKNGYETYIDDIQTIKYNYEMLQYNNYNNELLYEHFGNCIDYIDYLLINVDDTIYKIINELQNALTSTVDYMLNDMECIYYEPDVFEIYYIETGLYRSTFQNVFWNTENNEITEVK